MSQMTLRVGTCGIGSSRAAFGSGMRIMSLSWIFWNPRMLDPSNPTPSSQTSSSSAMGMEKCCQSPGRSLNFRSTIWMLLSLTNLATSSGVTYGPPYASSWSCSLYHGLSTLASTHANGVVHRDDEDLAIADVPRPGAGHDD